MASGVAVRQGGMWWVSILGNSQVLPLSDVVTGDAREISSVGGVASLVGNDCHGLNTDHALDREVGLVANYAG